MVGKYRKKPITIEALQWLYGNEAEVLNFIGDNFVGFNNVFSSNTYYNPSMYLRTLEGIMEVSINDYIIKGIHGEFYACKPDIFEETYDLVETVND